VGADYDEAAVLVFALQLEQRAVRLAEEGFDEGGGGAEDGRTAED